MPKLTVVPPSRGTAREDHTSHEPTHSGGGGYGPAFNEQFGIRIGRKTYYVNLRIGTESRSPERLAGEGQVRVNGLAFLYCVVCTGAIMLFGTLCLIYLIKSGMGINLTDGDSILHPLFAVATGKL
jgi:hypothetical protein